MIALTARQQMALDYINSSIERRGFPPTLREIAAHMGISSTNGVNDHLRALERKGYIAKSDMISRGIQPTPNVVRRDGTGAVATSLVTENRILKAKLRAMVQAVARLRGISGDLELVSQSASETLEQCKVGWATGDELEWEAGQESTA